MKEKQTVKEELEEISPLLLQLKQKIDNNGANTPERYFENFKVRKEKRKGNIISIVSVMMAAASILLLLFVFTVNNDQKDLFSNVSTEEIHSYIVENELFITDNSLFSASEDNDQILLEYASVDPMNYFENEEIEINEELINTISDEELYEIYQNI